MKLEGATEENILTLLCWDDKYAAQGYMLLTPDLFSTRVYRRLAELAFTHYENYNRPPKGHLRDECEDLLRKKDGGLLGETLDAMERTAPTLQGDYVLQSLEHFVLKRRMTMAVERASDLLQDDEIDKARDIFYNMDAQPRDLSPGIWLHDPDAMLSFMDKQDEDQFSMGIEALDERGISPARKTMTVLIAPPKKGKSWFLIEVGKANLRRGRKVLHITLENSQELTAQRYVQSLLALSKKEAGSIRVPMFERRENGHHSIRFDVQTPKSLAGTARASLAKELLKLKNRARFLIKEFPTATLSIAQLNAYLDFLAKTEAFAPDMIICDYPDLMAVDSANLRIDLGRLFKEFRGICVARNLAGVVVTQGGRDAAKAKLVTATMISEDFSKVMTADTVLTYSQTAEERVAGLARIYVAAARADEDQYIVLISQNYKTGQFCLDSMYMNHHMETEVERVAGDGRNKDDDDD